MIFPRCLFPRGRCWRWRQVFAGDLKTTPPASYLPKTPYKRSWLRDLAPVVFLMRGRLYRADTSCARLYIRSIAAGSACVRVQRVFLYFSPTLLGRGPHRRFLCGGAFYGSALFFYVNWTADRLVFLYGTGAYAGGHLAGRGRTRPPAPKYLKSALPGGGNTAAHRCVHNSGDDNLRPAKKKKLLLPA